MFSEQLQRLRHGGFWLPGRSLLLVSLAVAVYWLLGPAPESWVFDRAAIAQGEWWRLLAGHWVHSSVDHAIWDIGALLAMGFLFEKQLGGHLLFALLLGSTGVDAWIWWADSSLVYYCGLSGILNTLMVVGLVQLWREQRHVLILLVGLGFVGKVVMELVGGQVLLTHTAWPGVPEVHAVGLVCGILYTWLGMDQPKACYEECIYRRNTAAVQHDNAGGRQPRP